MPIYSVEGKLGTGKTKFAVFQAQNALRQNRRVASNVDLFLNKLLPNKATSYVRLPDKPNAFDLTSAGHGNPDSYDEDRNGVMILDELGTWLNSRSYKDSERSDLLDWLIHARKYGWDVYLIVQDSCMIDKQVRESLIEYQCRCLRGDKVKIPLIGGLLASIHKPLGYLPKFHLVTSRLGSSLTSVIADRWVYKGTDLHSAYDTRQVFSKTYDKGSYSIYYNPGHQKASPISRLFTKVKSMLKKRHYPPSLYWDVSKAAKERRNQTNPANSIPLT